MDEYAYFCANKMLENLWYKYFRNSFFKCNFKANANTQIAITGAFVSFYKWYFKKCWETHNVKGDIIKKLKNFRRK